VNLTFAQLSEPMIRHWMRISMLLPPIEGGVTFAPNETLRMGITRIGFIFMKQDGLTARASDHVRELKRRLCAGEPIPPIVKREESFKSGCQLLNIKVVK